MDPNQQLDANEQAIEDKKTALFAAREDRITKETQATSTKASHDGAHAAAQEAIQLELQLARELVELITDASPASDETAD